MKIVNMAIKDIIPYEKNAKKHDKVQIDNVAESIKQFGMVQPLVVDKDNSLIIGHCRLLAAKKLKMRQVPVVKLDELTDEQVKKLRLLDNKLNESAWDMELLLPEIEELDFDGFSLDWGGVKNKIEEEEEEEPEVEFSEILGEENNYLVLQFKNDVDWLQALSVFDVKSVKCYSTRKDGQITKKMERIGVGRVLDGAKVLRQITGDKL